MTGAALAMTELNTYPSLAQLMESVLSVWPEHQKYLRTRFANNDDAFLKRTDELAGLALTLTGDRLRSFCEDYRWMCENFIEEQLYFQRHSTYRLSSFEEANREVYSNAAYMQRYVNGILLSQVFWGNHAKAIDLFRTEFLPKNKAGTDYLEVGPGHGLFFYFAAQNTNNITLTGWDVSDTSINSARAAMQKMGVASDRFNLVHQDILAADCPAEQFDAVVISEVLEHLEQPEVALKSLHRALRRGGRIFINAPVNSPAPDHIYLWRTTEDLEALVQYSGFTIEQADYLPITGKTLEYCRKYNADISCVFIARKT